MIWIILHGMMEHSGRYKHVVQFLESQGHHVYAHDLPGHGPIAKQNNSLGHLHYGDWDIMVELVQQLVFKAKQEHPGLPVVLMGHSMGSFLAQSYAAVYGEELSQLILIGSTYLSPVVSGGALFLTTALGIILGWKRKAVSIHRYLFGSAYQWLCSDPHVVEDYLQDPLCGNVCTFGFYRELFFGLKMLYRKETFQAIPQDLPIAILAGSEDFLSDGGKKLIPLKTLYEHTGHSAITLRIFPGLKHELLNEVHFLDELVVLN